MRRTNAKSLSDVVRAYFAGMSLCLTCFSDALASVDICQDPADYSRLSIAYANYGDSTLDNDFGTVGQENNNFDLMVKSANDKLNIGSIGVGHYVFTGDNHIFFFLADFFVLSCHCDKYSVVLFMPKRNMI